VERHGLVYHKADETEESEESEADEMDDISGQQEESRKVTSHITGEYARGMLSKGSISPTAMKMMAETAQKSDRAMQPTPGALEIREKLGLSNPPDTTSVKKEVFNSNPMRGRKPLIAQEDEDDDEGDEDDDKAKLLAWKKELEEKFKKFDSFKEVKQSEKKPFEDRDVTLQRSMMVNDSIQNDYSITRNAANPMNSIGLQGSKVSDPRDSEISRPSSSIKIKDEIMANKSKEVNRRSDSQDFKYSYEKNNFFGASIDQKTKQEPALITQDRDRIKNTRNESNTGSDALRQKVEEAYIQIKDLEKNNTKGSSSKSGKDVSVQTTSDPLEKNFLKLKELYDTLYKANVALVKDQKELQEKYTKLLKAHNKGAKVKEDSKPAIKIKQETPLRQSKASVKYD
jgi:hypothetical protein